MSVGPIRWRLLDVARRSAAVRQFKGLLASQFYSREQLHAESRHRLAELLQAAASRPGQYSPLMRGRRITADNAEAVLRELPLTNREQVRDNPSGYVNHSARHVFAKRTGGSTGAPLHYNLSPAAYSASWGHIWRSWSATNVDLARPVGIVAGASVVGPPSRKRRLYFALNNWIVLSAFELSPDAAARFVSHLQRSRVELLYGYPSALLVLARWTAEPPSNLKAVVTTAETLIDSVREELEQRLRVPVFNQYGANDGGIQAFQCRPGGPLHVGVERCYAEVISDDGAVRDLWRDDGEQEGELLCTDLLNTDQLFIRYRVGDRVVVRGRGCECGRGLPTLERVTGRTSECVVLPSGSVVHGEFFSHLIRAYEDVSLFRVEQFSDGRVTVDLEVRAESFSRIQPVVSEAVRKRCVGVPIEIVRHDRLVVPTDRKFSVVTRSPSVRFGSDS